MPDHVGRIPSSFWALLELSRPSLAKLATALEGLSKAELERYQFGYWCALNDVVPDPSEGLSFVHRGTRYSFSEDDMVDFGHWVVNSGEEFFRKALSPLVGRTDLAREYLDDEQRQCWDFSGVASAYAGYSDPAYIAIPIYSSRFGGDLAERVEELADELM